MKKFQINRAIFACLFLQLFACSAFGQTFIMFRTIKRATADTYDMSVVISAENITGFELKGPVMAGFEAAQLECGSNYVWRRWAMPLADLQNEMAGTWTANIYIDDLSGGTNETVYTFEVDAIVDSQYPAVPEILTPTDGAGNVIAQDYLCTWDSKGNDSAAHSLWLNIIMGDVCYATTSLALDTTEWRPGWLEMGEAEFRIAYVWWQNYMLHNLTHVSGPVIAWDHVLFAAGGGDKHSFAVSKDLDINGDLAINLADIAYMFAHWLEEKQ